MERKIEPIPVNQKAAEAIAAFGELSIREASIVSVVVQAYEEERNVTVRSLKTELKSKLAWHTK